MLNFSLSPEQKAIQKEAREFALKELLPVAWEYDQREETPMHILHKAYDAGLVNGDIPKAYGGKGYGVLDVESGTASTTEYATTCATGTTTRTTCATAAGTARTTTRTAATRSAAGTARPLGFARTRRASLMPRSGSFLGAKALNTSTVHDGLAVFFCKVLRGGLFGLGDKRRMHRVDIIGVQAFFKGVDHKSGRCLRRDTKTCDINHGTQARKRQLI